MPLDGRIVDGYDAPLDLRRQHRGQRAYHAGRAAEDQVQADYQRRGYRLAATRWRGRCGEIDLIVQDAMGFVFVEVKKSRSFDSAAAALGPRQQARILRAAEEYLGQQGYDSLTEMRFDVALLNGGGEIRILENALGFC